jgi:hypothetical protein
MLNQKDVRRSVLFFEDATQGDVAGIGERFRERDIPVCQLLVPIERDARHEAVGAAVGCLTHEAPDHAMVPAIIYDVDCFVCDSETAMDVSRLTWLTGTA